ncbi:MAG: NFACT family protein, partial [Firmicutes bacterium]|nr:NFACT family protein [Bacillota bacterium]
LYGELLNANIYAITPGAKEVSVLNYYTGENITIPLDVKLSPSKNAQSYFKKYGKAKTAVKEKALQLEDVNRDIEYLESVSAFIDNAQTENEIEVIRDELIEGGYLRRRKNIFKAAKKKSSPLEYRTSEGYRVLVGRNNVENDFLTFKQAGSRDVWFHTKDIPGSHVILFTEGKDIDDLSEAAIFETASLAAYYSKGRASENVPVDYVQAKFVKKPNGAKPGMVIFTNNRTVWTNPALPETKEEK